MVCARALKSWNWFLGDSWVLDNHHWSRELVTRSYTSGVCSLAVEHRAYSNPNRFLCTKTSYGILKNQRLKGNVCTRHYGSLETNQFAQTFGAYKHCTCLPQIIQVAATEITSPPARRNREFLFTCPDTCLVTITTGNTSTFWYLARSRRRGSVAWEIVGNRRLNPPRFGQLYPKTCHYILPKARFTQGLSEAWWIKYSLGPPY